MKRARLPNLHRTWNRNGGKTNKADFADTSGTEATLHPALQAEAVERNLNVTLFLTLGDFISTSVKPSMPLTARVRAVLSPHARIVLWR